MQITSPKFDDAELKYVRECLESGWVTQGPFVKRFESQYATLQAARHGFAVTSCTAALHLAHLALNAGPGDEVIVPAFTWVTSAHSVEYTGAKAVFVDVDQRTFNIDPDAIEAAITPRTKGIVVVHLFGLPAAMDRVMAIAEKHGLYVVEDAACGVGAAFDGTPVGAIGDAGCFSLHPRKVITVGEGGVLTTNRDDVAEVVASLRNHGATGIPPEVTIPKPYTMATFNRLGYNFRMSDIQAAVGLAQMEKLEGLLAERHELAERYTEMLKDIPDIAPPYVPDNCRHTYQSYVIRVLLGGVERRNLIMDAMAEQDIQTRPGTHAVHRLGYYVNKYGITPGQFPVSAQCEDVSITLPIFPGMTEADQAQVLDVLKTTLAKKIA
jgi:perosamine synthetase